MRPKRLTVETVKACSRVSVKRGSRLGRAGTFTADDVSRVQLRLMLEHKLAEQAAPATEAYKLTPAGWHVVDAYQIGMRET